MADIFNVVNVVDLVHMVRHAKSREPGNLVPGHFWSKIRTFFRNQSFKDIKLKNYFVIDQIGVKSKPITHESPKYLLL